MNIPIPAIFFNKTCTNDVNNNSQNFLKIFITITKLPLLVNLLCLLKKSKKKNVYQFRKIIIFVIIKIEMITKSHSLKLIYHAIQVAFIPHTSTQFCRYIIIRMFSMGDEK